jgi:nitroreductase
VELDAAIRARRMCRDFAPDPVDPAVIDRCIDHARRAPSAGHTQGWAWVVLEGSATDSFWSHGEERSRAGGVGLAPVIVLPLISQAAYLERYSEPDKTRAGRDRPEAWPVPYWWVDGGGALAILLLTAAQEGLGALFFALHHPPGPLLAHLGVPPGWDPLGAVALGWPAPGWREGERARRASGERPAGSAGRGRSPLPQVIHRGRW